MQALRAGFGSVMYDGSREKTSEENIRKSAEIVRIAHGMGVGVECELGSVGGLTDSNGAARNGRSSYGTYRDRGNDDAFNNNHGSTFGGVGEELKEDAQQFPPTVWDSMTGNHGASGTATWRQMLDNGFVHDTDGFLLDGENACWS